MGNDRNWKREMKKMGVTTVKAFNNRAGCGNEEPGLQASVVLQPLLLCQGEDQLFVTKTNGKATEIVSVLTLTGGVNSLMPTVRNWQ